MSPAKPLPPKKVGGEDLAVSMDQDEFVSGGLPSDFDGEVTEARAMIWNYDNGNGPREDDAGNPILTLAVRATIRRDDGEEDVITYWSAGDPAAFVPSNDGATPSPVSEDGTSEGIYFIRTGSRTQLSNSTNYAQFLEALKDAESSVPHLARKRTPDVRFLEGLYGHWDRIPQKKRSGMVTREDDRGRTREILACTRISQPAPAKGKVAPIRPAASKPAPAAPATQSATSDLDDRLRALVLEAIAGVNGDALPKGKLAGKVLTSKGLQAAEKAKAVPRVTSNAFLEAMMGDGLLLFDEEAGTVAAIPEE